MGRVTVPAKIENISELFFAAKGAFPAEQVHRVEVSDALVDTGSAYLAMPLKLIQQLGFDALAGTYLAKTTNGEVPRRLFGPVRLTVQNRFCSLDVAELPDDCPVLIGQLALEAMDFVVDPNKQRLIGNPQHDGQQMMEMY